MTERQAHFLRLPYNIRRGIYRDLWMIVDHRSTLPCFYYGEWSSREQKLVWENNMNTYIPNQLFYVSRAISEDARAMIYSENYLWFHDEDCWGGLKRLLNLSPLGWKSLRNIVVTIGTKGCGCWYDVGNRALITECHANALEIIENDCQLELSGVLSTWRLICSRLAAYHTEDNKLELHLVCGAASQETAARFLAPIHDLPRLKGLSVRMGPYRNLDLQQIIMITIHQKTQYFPQDPKGSFHFQRLPRDIQICILEYSGLIAPKALISCFPGEPFIPTDCRSFECGALPEQYFNYKDCYCPSMYTAFSTVYQCCTPTIPHALFLVSKMIRELALYIYYARNVIEIWYMPSVDLPEPVNMLWEPHTSEFLSRVPEHLWGNLRHIHWVLPHMLPNAFHTNSRETDNWMNTLSTLFQAVQPSAGAITLELSFTRPPWAELSVDPRRNNKEWALYSRILEPIARWSSLVKDLFVHIYCHWYYMDKDTRLGPERSLEQKVMGAEYDSLLQGKVYPKHFQEIIILSGTGGDY
ncbi:hypothetical protein BDW59DRAFT_155484 [Aspergillus cavernicola]|uniref:F-box domain-containing protein n=1 Tax=Aspergillus cavernicola TaxID=176166 RepID=A0ABR4H8S6_9EURO